jgi:hypothetical protein
MICLIIAAHEVRHRIQHEICVKQFSLSLARKFSSMSLGGVSRDSMLKASAIVRRLVYLAVEKGKKRIRREEFDADVVAYFMANMWRIRKLTKKDIAIIMKTEPLKTN